jgi:hypothetical protein
MLMEGRCSESQRAESEAMLGRDRHPARWGADAISDSLKPP